MKQIEIKTIQEAKKIIPPLEIIRVALMLKQGETVTLIDEETQTEYIFKPQEQKGV